MTIPDRRQKVKEPDRGQRRIPRNLFVKSAHNLTPNMRRVTLYGDALEGFPENTEGSYIKLMFDQLDDPKPTLRTYTISKQRSAQNEIDIDFMLHVNEGDTTCGIAAPWSISAKAGDKISISGPGSAKFINTEAECFLLAADMTALPALTANLQRLPADASGKVFIEIFSEADKQDLELPANVEIEWVINSDPGSDESPLYHVIEEAAWQEGVLAVWVACEFKTMKKIRHYLKVEREVPRSHFYISSYWKRGNNEEAHKVAKRVDSEKNEM